MNPKHRPNTRGSNMMALGVSRTGLLIALGLGLVFAGILLWYVSKNPTGPQDASTDDVPSITSVPSVGDGGTIKGASEARLVLMSRDDPSKVAWIVHVDAFNPIEGGRVQATQPRAWVYLDAGRVMHIRANQASFDRALGDREPEAGLFEGDVRVRVFENAGNTRPDPALVPADALISTESLRFDSVRGEISTDDDVAIESPEVDALLRGLRAQFDEVDNRLERIEVPRGGRIAYQSQPALDTSALKNDALSPDLAKTSGPRIRRVAWNSFNQDEPAAPPVIHHYSSEFDDDVVVTQGDRRILADQLRVFLRTIDGAVPDDAVRDFTPATTRLDQSNPLALLAAAAIAQLGSNESNADSVPANALTPDDPPVILTWSGPMQGRYVSEAPAELDIDHLALRFEADQDHRVQITDGDTGATGDSDALSYGFTSRTLFLQGSADTPVRINAPGSGAFTGPELRADLSTGFGSAMGPGALRDTERDREIEWVQNATFRLHTEGGVAQGSLRRAQFSGGVRLRDTRSEVTGDELIAEFSDAGAREGNSSDGLNNLSAVRLKGNVDAITEGGRLSADELDVMFDASESGADPSLVMARGRVVATQGDSTINCGRLESTLARNVSGDIDVVEALMSDGAEFTRGDRTTASARQIRADNQNKITTLVGSPATVRQGDTTITGEEITLGETDGVVAVLGPGTFTHTTQNGENAEGSWTKSLEFVDTAGTLEAVGDVSAFLDRTSGDRDTFRGERLLATFIADETDEPATDEPADDTQLGDALELGGSRSLQTVTVLGGKGPSGEVLASVESLRYEEGIEAPAQSLLLTGDRIDADNTNGRLRVPSPGRLLLSDLRPPGGDSNSDTFARGAALFDWTGSLRFDRETGNIVLRRDVRLVHRPVALDPSETELLDPQGEVTELECERLTAHVDNIGVDSTSEASLKKVVCEGAVWARAGQRELLADRVEFRTSMDEAIATANPGGWVTVFDRGLGTPITASSIRWNPRSGRVAIEEPAPIVAPARGG